MSETSNDRISQKLRETRPRIVKRCFMTGKQCIFSSQIADKTSKKNIETRTDDDLKVFIVMPFKPNLETFYQWSLKPYLIDNYGLNEKNIQRASDVMGMEYIVCEKICKKIQESDLVFADISVKNSNVFYEIGLAYGLQRPIVLMQKEGMEEDIFNDNRIRMSLSYNKDYQNYIRNKIFRYQKIEKIKKEPRSLIEDHIIEPYNQPRLKTEMKISVFDFSDNKNEISTMQNDIPADFLEILIGAVNTAIQDIKIRLNNKIKYLDSNKKDEDNVWHQIYHNIDWEKDFVSAQTINVDGATPFDRITMNIESSFCSIINVTPDTPSSVLAYFWLGYCHSRGHNVIPVFRMKNEKEAKTIGEKLAFDIRSLWYADYYDDQPYQFKRRIREILEYLLMRDVPDRQKRDFWNRFPPEKEIKVFTGAIHVDDLMREVVGDWDVRTVSEIFSYLPTIRETTSPKLVSPFYSPEEAYKRFMKENGEISNEERREKFIQKFNGDIEKQLKNCNAIVIASPDVNPVSEYLLNKIYRVKCDNGNYQPFMKADKPNFDGFVVVKQKKKQQKDTDLNDEKFERLFYSEKPIQHDVNTEAQLKRGFSLHRHTAETCDYLEEYYNQAENKETFKLLGHLIVSKYPPDRDGDYVILLNGVSGPATFALAQILTGGGSSSTKMNSMSEEMLHEINRRLDDPDKPNTIGVQGLVEIEIGRGSDTLDISKTQGNEIDQYITNVDSRRVISWKWIDDTDHPQSIFG